MTRINLIATIVLTLHQSVTGAASNYATVPFVEFPALIESATAVRRALSTVGMVSIAGVPGFAEARQASLRAGLACLPDSQSAHRLADGTRRYSVAATSGFEMPKLDGADCLRFANDAAVLRSVVQHAVEQVIAVWQGQEDGQITHVQTIDGNQSLASAVGKAQHLEHFRVYEASDTPGVAGRHAALDLHTDAGLLLAFTAPMYADGELDSGLWIKEAGALKQVKLRDDSLVFLVGEAARLLPFSSVPVQHALILPEEASLRAWYGQMVLLPDGATFASGSTFGQWRKESAKALASGDRVQLGCGSAAELSDMHDPGCKTNEVLCWLGCKNKSSFYGPGMDGPGDEPESCKAHQNAVCYSGEKAGYSGPPPPPPPWNRYGPVIDETKPWNGRSMSGILECIDEPIAALRMLDNCNATEEAAWELTIRANVCWPYGHNNSVMWNGCHTDVSHGNNTFQVWTNPSCAGGSAYQVESGGCVMASIHEPKMGPDYTKKVLNAMQAVGRCPTPAPGSSATMAV